MNVTRRTFLAITSVAAAGAALGIAGCSPSTSADETTTEKPSGTLAFDNTAWNYDATNDVYWQIGIVYCAKPAATTYESLGIYVPGAYLNATKNGGTSDKTSNNASDNASDNASNSTSYTCTINESGKIDRWTARSAPIILPVNTAGYSAQAAPTSYSYESVADYLEAGFIYVYAGCRGRDNGYAGDGSLEFSGGAPWAITDLKAAIRYLRYNDALLPGDKSAVFTFGHSGGGAQSALVGATGDSDLYLPYLESIGAATNNDAGTNLSDAIAGSMCWCPITCLDEADAAYEWMMGQYTDTGTRASGTWTSEMSKDLASSFADYINTLDLENNGETLTLATSDDAVFAAGSYYDYIRNLIEESLNNFLSDTTFPYTPSNSTMADGGFGGGLGGEPNDMPGGGQGETPDGNMPGENARNEGQPADQSNNLPNDSTDSAANNDLPGGNASGNGPNDMPGENPPDSTGGITSTGGGTTYNTAQDYINSLNANENWIDYDAATNTATITDVGAFVRQCKKPGKDVGAFDATDRSQAENKVFGNDDYDALHFDATMTHLLQENAAKYAALSNWDTTLPEAYAHDRELTDSLGTDIDTRVGMYNPLYYLSSYYDGYGAATIAPHWRIRTGIEQTDTSLTVEANLALALQSYADVKDVDFATVWGQGHTTAERTGSSTANFIEWVNGCMQ